MRRRRRRARARSLDAPEKLPGGDLVLLVFENLTQDPCCGCRNFDRYLVGLNLDQWFILDDRIARLLQPAQEL